LWPFTLFAEDLLKATGNVKKLAKLESIISPIRFIIIILAATKGLTYVALASVISYLIKYLFFIFSLKQFGISITNQLKPIIPNILQIAPPTYIIYLITEHTEYSNSLTKITNSSFIFLISWLATFIIIQSPLYKEIKNIKREPKK
jgi:hypothetical protein